MKRNKAIAIVMFICMFMAAFVNVKGVNAKCVTMQEQDTFYWEDAELRTWLNDYEATGMGFGSKAFSEEERQYLCETFTGCYYQKEIDYPELVDKVFLPDSYKLQQKGMTETKELQMWISDYAYAQGLCKQMVVVDKATYDAEPGEQIGNWWLRYSDLGFVEYVNYDGYYCCDSFGNSNEKVDIRYMAYASDMTIGICPAILLDLSDEELWEAECSLTKEEVEYLNALSSTEPKTSEDVMNSEIPPKASESVMNSEIPPEASNVPIIIADGDVDENGKVELQDAQLVLKAALKMTALQESVISRADVVKDDFITLEDAQMILKMALKVI